MADITMCFSDFIHHHEDLCYALEELYGLLVSLEAIPMERFLLYVVTDRDDFNVAAALAAGYTPEAVNLMRVLPYLKMEDNKFLPLLPHTFPINHPGADKDEEYFRAQRRLLTGEEMAPTAIRLTRSEVYGTEYIYDTATSEFPPSTRIIITVYHPLTPITLELLTLWRNDPTATNGYPHVMGLTLQGSLGLVIRDYRELRYLATPWHVDFSPATYANSGGTPPQGFNARQSFHWLSSYDVWEATQRLRNMYLEHGWDIHARDQHNFDFDEFLDERDAYMRDVIMPLLAQARMAELFNINEEAEEAEELTRLLALRVDQRDDSFLVTCLYYQDSVSRCASYGRPGHEIAKRTIPVGFACSEHSQDLTQGNGSVYVPYGYNSDLDNINLEDLIRGLLEQNGLCNLWPQIIAGRLSPSDARQTIDGFLQRFANDLDCLATKTNDALGKRSRRVLHSSSSFIRRYQVEIASKICQAHGIPCELLTGDTNTYNTAILAAEDAHDAHDYPFTFSVAKDLIFGTEPISYLESNICDFIRQQQQKKFSRLMVNIRTFTSSVAQAVCQAPIPTGKRRVNWTCVCGCRVIDDYESKCEGAIEAFKGRLKQYNRVTQPVQGHLRKGAIPTAIQWIRNFLATAKSPGLPSYRRSDDSLLSQLGSCVSSAGTSQANHNFVLLCVPYLRWGLRLHNSEVCKINSDQQFFKLLQQCYFAQRHRPARKLLRIFTKVRALQFVKFEVFRNKLVDVRACPSLPTASNDYTYDPMPPDVIPPIGPNLLMHLFENPDHADVTLFLYKRFPKKMRAQLEACPTKGSSIGWGVEFVEGVNWYAVFVSGLLGFALEFTLPFLCFMWKVLATY
ncbi:hypothetical protein FHL15_010143 [Xylaria flabelliformis]|uniref:Uncharacterized protein n=1 Tax=Xylaria flabelliformis TaxID=2512241 RepID=A0A553HLS6_9PEZI|nr:hypothetical protein FHL15_010143 [Xylaria flabelliformis]